MSVTQFPEGRPLAPLGTATASSASGASGGRSDARQGSRAQGARRGEVLEQDCRNAAQFTRHITTVLEEQTRAALERYVGDVKAGELVEMARNLGQMKARYMAHALAVGTNRTPPSREDAQELRWMREQFEELDLAFQAIREAITNEQVAVGDLGGRGGGGGGLGSAGDRTVLRQPQK